MNYFSKSSYLYTPLFCEENMWHLTNSLITQGIKEKEINILFITNKNKKITIFNQLAATNNKAAVWDYHVILLARIENLHYIFDFDTRLPFPDKPEHYLEHSLPDNIDNEYSAKFRIISANAYLKYFSSDRSHMINIIPDALFPSYPAILSDHDNQIYLTDLFDIKKKINNTRIFQDKRQLIKWIKNL